MATFSFTTPDIQFQQRRATPLPVRKGAFMGALRGVGRAFTSSLERGTEAIRQARQQPAKPLLDFQQPFGVRRTERGFEIGGPSPVTPSVTPTIQPQRGAAPIRTPFSDFLGQFTGRSRSEAEAEASEAERQRIIAARGQRSVVPGAVQGREGLVQDITQTKTAGVTPTEPEEPDKFAGILERLKALETPKTPITEKAEEKTKSSRDKLIDLLLQRATEPSDLEAHFKKAREEAGIPTLETTREKFISQIGKVEDLLSNIEKDITERTKGFDVGAAFRRRMEAAERESLTEELRIATRGLAGTEAALEPKERFAQKLTELRAAGREAPVKALTAVSGLEKEAEELGIKREELGIKKALTASQVAKNIAEVSPGKAQLELDKLTSEIEKNRASAAASYARASQVGKGRPLPAQRADFFASSQSLLDVLDQLEDLINKGVETGPIAGISAAARRTFGIESSKRLTFNALAKNISDLVLRVRSGAQTGEKEFGRIMQFLPDVGFQEQVNKANINEMRNTLKRVVSLNASILKQTGFNVPEEAATGISPISEDILDQLGFEEE